MWTPAPQSLPSIILTEIYRSEHWDLCGNLQQDAANCHTKHAKIPHHYFYSQKKKNTSKWSVSRKKQRFSTSDPTSAENHESFGTQCATGVRMTSHDGLSWNLITLWSGVSGFFGRAVALPLTRSPIGGTLPPSLRPHFYFWVRSFPTSTKWNVSPFSEILFAFSSRYFQISVYWVHKKLCTHCDASLVEVPELQIDTARATPIHCFTLPEILMWFRFDPYLTNHH